MFHVKHLALAALLLTAPAVAQQAPWYGGAATGTAYPNSSTPVVASATGNNAFTSASLPAVTGKTTFVCGFSITTAGSATASNFNILLFSLVGSVTMTFAFEAPAAGQGVLVIPFRPCIPANPASSITINMPAAGAGSSQSVNLWGYQSGT